jgi:dTDP-glucose 4,6-dehydratase
MRKLLVAGGAGFIGSNYVRYVLNQHRDAEVVVYDKLTYAGNLENLEDVARDPRYRFVRGDIGDALAVAEAIRGCDAVVNFAAETHVDRSLLEPDSFIQTNVHGTWVLLEAALRVGVERYLQVSTDEVYGSLAEGSAREGDRLNPSSAYSASKAGGDMMVNAYFLTYGLPAIITRGSNNFGPYQYPEKAMPLFILHALDDRPLPVYGDGQYVRDWLHVLDHCSGIDVALWRGTPGEIYNVGGGNELTNLELIRRLLRLLSKPESLIQYVKDRPGHDRRYSVDCSKLKALGWQPAQPFEGALAQTVAWYRENEAWWRKIQSGEYRDYYRRMYEEREVSPRVDG